MASAKNGRLGDYKAGMGVNSNDSNSASKMPPLGSLGSAWGNVNGIWGSAIGSGIKSGDGLRSQARSQFTNGNDRADTRGLNSLDQSEEITGSGSLLSSSESEPWGHRRNSAQWPAMGNSAFGANARNGHTSTSPVRSRTNQPTRSNSPYMSNTLPAIGTTAPSKSSQPSHLDPTSRTFNASGIFSSQLVGSNLRQNSSEAGPNFDSSTFGTVGPNGVNPYSGYASSAASRSGSLPPSRHGNDAPPQFGDFPANSFHTSKSDIFSHHRNQASRSSNFSATNSGRMADSNWGMANDLSSGLGRMDLNRDANDFDSNSFDFPYQPNISGSMNGSFNNSSYQRNGSISYDTDSRMPISFPQQFNRYQQLPYSDMSSQSAFSSEGRRGQDSPFYISNTPPLQEHHRAASTHSARSASGIPQNYNHPAILENRLRRAVESQPYGSVQSSPTLAYRQNGQQQLYPYTGNMTPAAVARLPSYYPNVGPISPYPLNTMHANRGIPRGPALDPAAGESVRSARMDEFRSSKGNRKYDLKDIYGYVVEFSGDQHGSRFIQQKLETANSDEKQQLFNEIIPNAWQLMTDVFGNYVIQKFFEHGNQNQKKLLAERMKGHIADLSLQMYGCRVVQKAFEHILTDQQAALVKELEPDILKCIKDQNGNHVVQKAIHRIPPEHVTFINKAVKGNVHHLAIHAYGCRVIQRMLEYCPEQPRDEVIEELHACAFELIDNQYGNYVIQNVMEHGHPEDRLKLTELTIDKVLHYSKHKYASNVVEHCLREGSKEHQKRIVDIVRGVDARGEPNMVQLVRDQYANYVIQTIIKILKGEELASFMEQVKTVLEKVRQQSYGKHIGQIEKLVEDKTKELRESQQHQGLVDTSAAPTPPPLMDDAQSPQSSSQPSTTNSTADGPVHYSSSGSTEKQGPSSISVAGDEAAEKSN